MSVKGTSMENVTVRHLNKKPFVQFKTLHEGALKCARQVKHQHYACDVCTRAIMFCYSLRFSE